MKKVWTIFFIAFIVLLCTLKSIGQPEPKNAKFLKDTVVSKKTVRLYEGARGGRFIVVLSKNGNVYKRYFN